MGSRVIEAAQLERFRNAMLEDEKSSATIAKYSRDVESFLAFAEGTEITKEVVIRYKQHLTEKYAPSSVNSMLAALNRFLKEIGRYDCVVKALRIQRQAFRGKERELTKAEYYRLLDAARKKGDNRLYMLMQTICATGIRVSELRFITVEALQRGRATVSLKGKTRQVLIPKALSKELTRYVKERGIKTGSIFVTSSGKPMDRSNILHRMKALCETARVAKEKVFPHNLRHLFACLYYKMEKDLSRLADLLGHSSLNTTRIYTSLSGAEQQRQIDRLGLVL
ncbi:MAG: integrase [Ruminococcaceae bacterium]|nr:integrase [Oscillospiraceae bacterium]